jgi:hypothetical protein
MITCAELMIEDPSTAIYWGSLPAEDHGGSQVSVPSSLSVL